MSINENVIVSIISALSGILVAYITVRYKRSTEKPKAQDRIDIAFNAYERIIKQLESDNEDLRAQIDGKDILIASMRKRK